MICFYVTFIPVLLRKLPSRKTFSGKCAEFFLHSSHPRTSFPVIIKVVVSVTW